MQANDSFGQAAGRLDEEAFQALYGTWHPMAPEEVASLLSGFAARWWIAGGRAARVGAAPRPHEDTDVIVLAGDLDALREVMRDWHLWEAVDGALRPLLPTVAVRAECEQLWARRDARSPWRLEFLVDRASTDREWVFKRDPSVRLPWSRAVHVVDGIGYLRPEVALLFKPRGDRAKDRADLLAAQLAPAERAWLADTLEKLGYDEWVRLARSHGRA